MRKVSDRFSGNVVELKRGRRWRKLTPKLRDELLEKLADKWLELLFESGISPREMAREIESMFLPRRRRRGKGKRSSSKASRR